MMAKPATSFTTKSKCATQQFLQLKNPQANLSRQGVYASIFWG
jgi:hypothetical protein